MSAFACAANLGAKFSDEVWTSGIGNKKNEITLKKKKKVVKGKEIMQKLRQEENAEVVLDVNVFVDTSNITVNSDIFLLYLQCDSLENISKVFCKLYI